MGTYDWEDLKEEICTQLWIGKEKGEAELETMARIVWLERQKCLALFISEEFSEVHDAALELVERASVDQDSGSLPKGKVLEWKTGSRLTARSVRV